MLSHSDGSTQPSSVVGTLNESVINEKAQAGEFPCLRPQSGQDLVLYSNQVVRSLS